MGSRNNKNVPGFILMGLTESEEIQQVLFMLFLLIYLITLLGNARMILIIHLEHQLHTPMYFFFSVTCHSLTSVIHQSSHLKELTDFQQIYFIHQLLHSNVFFVFLASTERFLLSSMAYDCYVAICNPFHYPVVVSTSLCCTLISGSYVICFTESLIVVLYMNSFHFCKSNVIYHFFCDTIPILPLSCTDIRDNENVIFIFASSTLMLFLVTISVSYGSILSTVMKINSTSEKCKAFSTCDSHFLGVTIFYSTMIFNYLKPKQSYSLGKDEVASVFYTMVIPMLNLPIYSLRNKEVKDAFIRVMQKRLQAIEMTATLTIYVHLFFLSS